MNKFWKRTVEAESESVALRSLPIDPAATATV